MSRPADRRDFDIPTRVTLLESDLDEADVETAELRGMLLAVEAKLGERLDRLNGIATGILSALVVAAILLAINLAVVR